MILYGAKLFHNIFASLSEISYQCSYASATAKEYPRPMMGQTISWTRGLIFSRELDGAVGTATIIMEGRIPAIDAMDARMEKPPAMPSSQMMTTLHVTSGA